MTIAMSKEEAHLYARDGYILRKGLLSADEVEKFRDRAREQLEQEKRSGAVMAKGDKEGKTTFPGCGPKPRTTNRAACARRADGRSGAGTLSASRSILQPQDDHEAANEGGAWEWHQDFGYW